jgi:hypothetical protein
MSTARIVEILDTLAPVSVTPDVTATTNAYVDIGLLDAEGKTRVVYTIKNEHATRVIDWKVLASVDNVTFIELKAEATLAGVTASSWVASATETSYRYFKLQVKSDSAGLTANVTVRGYAKM